MSYTGRQDFGDGEGNLLDHVKAFADYYLHTEEGQKLMKQTARTTEEWEHEQQQMRWVLEEMLPTLQYFCNLEKLETAVLEEQEIEKKVNHYIWMNQQVNIFYPDERQRKFIPYRSKKELTGEIRLVEFPGADLCACCGLHVTHASQIGLVKILSCKKFRDGVRMEMLSGKRALDYLSGSTEQNSQIAVSLSVKENETKEAVQRLLDEVYDLKGQLAQENKKALRQKQLPLLGKAMYSSSRIQWKQQKSESAPIPF